MAAEATFKVLLVGEDNPYGQDPRFALYHRPRHASGNRLRQHLGLRDATYERLRKVNLCSKAWAIAEARARAEEIKHCSYQWNQTIVLLGAKVRGAFGFASAEFFSVTIAAGLTPMFVVLPHPSGLSRPWNHAGAREEARKLLRSVAPQVPWGEVEGG